MLNHNFLGAVGMLDLKSELPLFFFLLIDRVIDLANYFSLMYVTYPNSVSLFQCAFKHNGLSVS